MTLVRLILLLGICVTGFVTIECVDCSNEAGYCDFSSSYLKCYITTNDTQLIKTLLNECSSSNSSFTYIDVHKYYVSSEYGNFLINIELPTNIRQLNIYNSQDQDHIRLTTSSQNTALLTIYSDYYIELESNDFFTHFTGLQYIYMNYVLSREPPSFTNLHSLTYLRVYLVGTATHALDEGIVSGLTNLVYLNLYKSYFNGISKGAFRNLNRLTGLLLPYNPITYIEDGALSDLSSLKQLYLSNTEIQNVSDSVFEGLTDLTYLELENIPGFPLNALIQAKSVITLVLRYNGYHTIDPYVFQQMNSLEYLYLSDPFVCDCSLQWTSLVGQYGLDIESAVCSESEGHFLRSITDQSLYTNCSQTESFQCFNKSITCPNNQVCHNTENSYFCGCPREYSLHSSGQCKDVDECDEMTDCQHACQNTEGSYYCTCQEGYELNNDGYNCNDVNECQEWNGGCEFGCRNTIGSYQCYCEYGHQLYSNTNCLSDIECDIVNSNENKNPDQLESRFTCEGGFNLSVSNLICPNVQNSGGIISTSSLFIIAVIIIIIQVIVIIVILSVFFHKIKTIKTDRDMVAKAQQSKQSKKVNSEEQTYHNISELPQIANPVQVSKSRYQQDVNNKKYTQLPKTEEYPGKSQDDLQEFANL